MAELAAFNATLVSLEKTVDHEWILQNSFLIFYIQAGFLALEAGLVRQKNVMNILLKNLVDTSAGAIAFFCFGYAWAFGDGNGFIGFDKFFLFGVTNYSFYMFQWSFSATAATIVSGSMAERSQTFAYLANNLLMNLWTYPVVAHWLWSGQGWLTNIGALDFAGGGVVHLVGGTAGFIGASILGPRIGRFVRRAEDTEHSSTSSELESGNIHTDDRSASESANSNSNENVQSNSSGSRCSSQKSAPVIAAESRVRRLVRWVRHPRLEVVSMPGANIGVAALGVFIIWYGFYAFNTGSTFRASGSAGIPLAGHIAIYTSLCASCGALSVLCYKRAATGKYDLASAMNGILAGLVASTSLCAYSDLWTAFVVGTGAGFVYLGASWLSIRIEVDDPLDAAAVHAGCGVWSMLCCGLFARAGLMKQAVGMDSEPEAFGMLVGGGSAFFFAQVFASLIIICWTAFWSFITFKALLLTGLLRVSADEELVGLDTAGVGGSTVGQQLYSLR